jgi:hypothetical protein
VEAFFLLSDVAKMDRARVCKILSASGDHSHGPL